MKKKEPASRSQKQQEQSMLALEKVDKFDMAEVIAEVDALNPNDYAEILQWICSQKYSKIVYVSRLSNINIFVKCVASCVVNDIKNNSSKCLDSILPYIAQKMPVLEQVQVQDVQPRLTIEVSNAQIENDLQKLIASRHNEND